MTISRFSLPYWKEIVDEYFNLDMDDISLRMLNPFGLSRANFSKVGYSAEEFLKFYEKALDYIIELSDKKKERLIHDR